MRGKYSPTVNAAYMANREWFLNYCVHEINSSEYAQYDPEGFDAYGYDENEVDRAGNSEHVYYENNAPDFSSEDYNWVYDAVLKEWGFDGTKPVRK